MASQHGTQSSQQMLAGARQGFKLIACRGVGYFLGGSPDAEDGAAHELVDVFG